MANPTEAQKKIFEAVRAFIRDHNYPPTLRELCKEANLKSTWTVRYHLKKLAEAGFLRQNSGLSRGITLIKSGTGIPIIGRVSAGKPIDAIENVESTVEVKGIFSSVENIFALRVKGDSMINAGIFDGDIVFVKKQPTAVNGDIVAAIIGEEAVVKRFKKTENTIKLISENPKYEPIISKNVKIAGKVVGVIRKY